MNVRRHKINSTESDSDSSDDEREEEDKKEDDDYDHNKFFEEMIQKIQSEVGEPDKKEEV